MSIAHTGPQGDDPEEMKLSPSEQRGHNIAMRLSGAGRGGRGSTQKALASIALGFEMFVIFLTGLTVYGLQILDPAWWGIVGGVALCAISVVALACMRFGLVGILLGWTVQALFCASAILLPGIIVPAVLFVALWVYCMVKGGQIDRQKALWAAQNPE